MSSRVRGVILLLAVSLFAARITGRELFYNLTYFWLGLLIISFLWSRLALRGLTVERKARSGRAQVGGLFVEAFRLRNESRIPKLWVEVSDASDLPGRRVTTVTVGLGFRGPIGRRAQHAVTVSVGLRPGYTRTWITRTLCTRRGNYRLGPTLMRSSDPFGLFPVERAVAGERRIVVLPLTVPIRRFPLPSGRLAGGEAVRRRTQQVTPNAAGVRDYVPGDSLNRIHWLSTARRRKLIVKEFELDPLADLWLIIDGCREAQAARDAAPDYGGDGRAVPLPPSTEEYAVSAAASLAMHFLALGRSVGLIGYGERRRVIQPDSGEAQRIRILDTLAVLRAKGDRPLHQVLKIEAPRIPQGSSVILLTPSDDLALLEAISHLAHAGRRPILMALEASTFGGPEASPTLAQAAERNGIPVRIIRCGEPLTASLSGPLRGAPFSWAA